MKTDRYASRERMRDIVLFVSVTGVHLFVSVALFVFVFGRGMARFDSGAPRGEAETVAGWAFAILSVPLLSVLERMPVAWFPGLWGYVPSLANASLWGLAAVAVRWHLRARASQRPAP